MRLLLCLVALVALVHAGPTNKWGKVFSSFFAEPHTFADNYHGEIAEPTMVRVKRAVYAALGISSPCTPGWTGPYCENPICDSRSPYPQGPTQFSKLVDLIYMPSGCTGNYYIPIDGLSTGFSVQVATSAGTPFITMTDASGNVLNASSTYPSESHNLAYYDKPTPGKYQLTVDNRGISTTHCVATIEANSNLYVMSTFVGVPQMDKGPHGASAEAGKMMNLAVHVVGLSTPAYVATATIYKVGTSTQPVLRSLLTPRYQCNYEFYVGGTFTCDPSNTYIATIEGTDGNGNSFRRSVGNWGCVVVPTPPVTTPSPPKTCLNGGTLLYPNSPNSQCLCTELFTGTQCEQVLCMNGGKQLPEKLSCLCPDGFSGPNCQNVVCGNNVGQYLSDSKTFIVVIRAVQSMNQYINTIVANIEKEYQYMSQFDAYRQFMLVTVVNGDYQTFNYWATDYQKFLKSVASLNATNTVGNCNETTIAAIGSVFKQIIYNKSPIYVFTDAPASDYNDFRYVTEANAFRKLPIYTFFMNTTAAQNCKVDEMSEGYRIMGTLAYMSGGLVFAPSNGNFSTTMQMAVRATTYKMNQVLIDDLTVCKMDGVRTFFVDSATQHITIIVTGENMIVAITDPNGKVFSPLVYNDGRNYFYNIAGQNLIKGEYFIQMTSYQSQYPCSYRVYARSDYDLFVATTEFVALDGDYGEPVFGKSRALVAQLNGLGNITDPFRLFSEIMVFSNDNGYYHKPLYLSNGIYRSGCGYHMYFGYSNFCEYPGQVFYAVVYADDPYGYTIQRTAVGYCSGTDTTDAPPTTCVNGGVQNPMNATQCICPPNYTGRYCEQLVCLNGGTYDVGVCRCPPGLGGTFCEENSCLATNTEVKFGEEGRSMTFVVSTLQSMQAVWKQLSDGAADFVRDIQTHSPTWISKWNLVIMNQTNVQLVKSTSSPQGFIDAIQAINKNLANYYDPSQTNCSVKLDSALLLGVQNSIPMSYVYAWLDSDGQTEYAYIQLLALTETQRVSLNLIGTSKSICNGPGGQFSLAIRELSAFSNGWVYHSANGTQMLNFITTSYQNGISAERYYPDCTKNQTLYIPVDGSTQSMTLTVSGDTPQITVFQPDGTPARHSQYEINLVNDGSLLIDQYIIPCPTTEWTNRKAYCYKYGTSPSNYLTASQKCHSAEGFLIDIHNADKQAFTEYEAGSNAAGAGVQIYIGLIRNNGKWYWDSLSGLQPMEQGDYSNWATGQDLNDPNKPCVRLDGYGKWVTSSCDASSMYLCQRHRYGQKMYPGDPSTNLVPPGIWKVLVQTASGSCAVQARSQSLIQVYYGFTQDTHSDFPEYYANSDASNNYFAVGTTGLSRFHPDKKPSLEGRVNYAYMGFNGTLYNALTFDDRRSCSFQMLSQNFACKNKGGLLDTFFVKFSGLDQYGFTFDRYSNGYCGKYVTTCKNGGTQYMGQCVCPPRWQGQSCQIPVCEGGVLGPDNKCQCQAMFSGTHCQFPICEPPYPATFGDKKKTLAIALETSTLMGSTLFMLKRNLANVIQGLSSNNSDTPQWFDNYILYPFDSITTSPKWYPITITNDFNVLVNAVKNISMGCPGGTCENFCPRPYLRVIDDILARPELSTPNSVVLVITRSSPEDYDIYPAVMKNIMSKKAKINFLLPAVTSPCGEGWNTPQADVMRSIVAMSRGGIFLMSPTELTNSWMPKFLPTLYSSGPVENGERRNCSFSESYFQIEHSTYEFTIDYFAASLNMTLYNPAGDMVPLPPSLITSANNYLGIVKVNDTGSTMAGTYRLVTIAPGSMCALAVAVRSNIEVYPAFTQVNDQYNGATQDDAHDNPVIGADNIVIVHAAGMPMGARIEYVQAVMPSRRGLFFTSEMRRRDAGCSYEYYSTKSFECFAEAIEVIVYGWDERGAAFHRNFVVNCVPNRPRPPPPPAWCDLTKTKNDIVFLVDSSLTAGAEVFGVFKIFMNAVLSSYSIGTNGTQAGTITISSATPGSGAIVLNGCQDINCLKTRISNMQPDLLGGQNLTQAINYITTNYAKPSQGYRADNTVRHKVIYLTASNTFTDGGMNDPIQAVTTMKRSGTFGMALVGLNVKPSDSLMSIANAYCSYYANDMNDMGVNAVNFVQGMSCYRQPICGF